MPQGRVRPPAGATRPAAVPRPPESFEAFYQREYRVVVALAYGLSGSRVAAEELAQEAFLAAHRDWERVGVLEPADPALELLNLGLVGVFSRGFAKAALPPSSSRSRHWS